MVVMCKVVRLLFLVRLIFVFGFFNRYWIYFVFFCISRIDINNISDRWRFYKILMIYICMRLCKNFILKMCYKYFRFKIVYVFYIIKKIYDKKKFLNDVLLRNG